MSSKIVVLFVLLVLLTIGGAVWARRSATQDSAKTSTPLVTKQAAMIAGYQRWTKVNPEPVQMDQQVAAMCAPAQLVQASTSDRNPHRAKFITVYVNDLGRHAMTEEFNPRFPVGTVIVKEKLPNKDATAAELLTVMRKRERGYDSKNGDWEYLMFDGPGRVVQEPGKTESCQSCHMTYERTDYVTRLYLPADTRKSLK
jgi:hypothetical protein